MSERTASRALQMVPVAPPLAERELPAAGPEWGALEWQGEVRLAADRAAGLSASRWQQHVRTGLLERVLVLGADYHEAPHGERPGTARRVLAHIDALAEAAVSPADLAAFAEEAELEHPGALWILTLLFGRLGRARRIKQGKNRVGHQRGPAIGDARGTKRPRNEGAARMRSSSGQRFSSGARERHAEGRGREAHAA